MKINELLKPNEGFKLNEVQVAGNRCCLYVHSGAGRREFQSTSLTPSTTTTTHTHTSTTTSSPPSPWPCLWYLLTLFPEVAVSAGLADGNVPFSSVFIGRGEHGKRKSGILCGPTPKQRTPPHTHTHTLLQSSITTCNPLCSGTCEEIMMSEKMGLDL